MHCSILHSAWARRESRGAHSRIDYAERDDIKVLRGVGDDQQSMPFDYSAVERGEALGQNIVLQPGDVVIVP